MNCEQLRLLIPRVKANRSYILKL